MSPKKTLLLIARHGNTFDAGDVVRRVGRGTDLPLSSSGKEQAAQLGRYLTQRGITPSIIYSATLQRTYQTAAIARAAAGLLEVPLDQLGQFDEIDYGPDEGKPEEDVVRRIGPEALAAWDRDATVPPGWAVDVPGIIGSWIAFGQHCLENQAGKTILVVTSNGIARFAPHLTGQFEQHKATLSLKISTGAVCHLSSDGNSWRIDDWNIKPAKWLQQEPSVG